jgi:hypothetical protein
MMLDGGSVVNVRHLARKAVPACVLHCWLRHTTVDVRLIDCSSLDN